MNISSEKTIPGPVLLFGSGETLPSSGKAYEHLVGKIGYNPRISILETPAGFQPNSPFVAKETGDYIKRRLQNHKPIVDIIPARRKDGPFSTNNLDILLPLLNSNWIMMGPGSPTYAVDQLESSLVLKIIQAKHLNGAALSFASAAVLALSSYTLPVYEIYKAGSVLHWINGLNYLKPFGLELVFVPHWNNKDGGEKLDTSRCFMGKGRFKKLLDLIPEESTIVGIDEQTAICFNFEPPFLCEIFGKGQVTIIQNGQSVSFKSGQQLYLPYFQGFHFPASYNLIEEEILTIIEHANLKKRIVPSQEVLELVEKREQARLEQDWETSDRIRDEILSHGWRIKDTESGQSLEQA